MAKKNQVATKNQSTEVSFMEDMLEDAGMGLENADKDSFAIPFLTVLQGLSPQLESIDGAKPGLIINTITEELHKEVMVVPCAYQRRYLRWAPRELGGGYRGDHSPIEVDSGQLAGVKRDDDGVLTIEGDVLKDTRNHFCMVQSETGGWQPCLLSLSSTQIKKSKRWMSLIQGVESRTPAGKVFTPPSFANIYKLSTLKEENSKGSWWGVKIELDGPVAEQELYQKARDFSKQVMAGEVQVSEPIEETPEKNFEPPF